MSNSEHVYPTRRWQTLCKSSLLKSKNVTKPIIGFPFKAGSSLIDYSYESNVNCIALDWTVNLNWAIKNLNSSIAIQGNLDPASLIPFNSSHLENIVLSILNIMKDNKFIFSVVDYTIFWFDKLSTIARIGFAEGSVSTRVLK